MVKIIYFIIGLIIGAIGAFMTGFFQSAGSDTWSWIKRKLKPGTPEPRIVSRYFTPNDISDTKNIWWVLDTNVVNYEAKGFEVYRDSEGRICKRQTRKGEQLFEEILMIK